MFRKVLVANRGEIAVRVIRACRDMGIASVAVYSEADVGWPHVQMADEAYHLGPAAPSESYLSIGKLIEIARRCEADAVHPGYGFLAERPEFARACRDAGLAFVGPTPEAMALLGSKTQARKVVSSAGVPTIPGTMEPLSDHTAAGEAGRSIGYPIMLKAAAGGGGKGMRAVYTPELLDADFRMASNEAGMAFGDRAVYVEKLIERPRHVEVQVLGDRHGNLVALGERECSVQRRHQKLIEESPSPAVDADLRERLHDAALRAARAASYTNAGTVEFLLDAEGNFYFLEVNARIQVEHPVTELVTGLDLVQEQLRLAWGEPLGYVQQDVTLRGHAIECRVSAEDPRNQFFPSAGRLEAVIEPAGPGVRVDSGIAAGVEVSLHYDSLLAKLIVWGSDRHQACRRMARALDEYQVLGVQTTLSFHRFALQHPDFLEGRLDTGFVERAWGEAGQLLDEDTLRQAAIVAALVADRRRALPAPPVGSGEDGEAWRLQGRTAQLGSAWAHVRAD